MSEPEKWEYWYKQCPWCDQGRLMILYVTRSECPEFAPDSLYFHCDECERGFTDPELSEPLLTLDFEFDAEFPSENLLRARDWMKFAAHRIRR